MRSIVFTSGGDPVKEGLAGRPSQVNPDDRRVSSSRSLQKSEEHL
jgi:hypothetical protein